MRDSRLFNAAVKLLIVYAGNAEDMLDPTLAQHLGYADAQCYFRFAHLIPSRKRA